MRLRTKGAWFTKKDGKRVLLRGVNLGGSTKLPFSEIRPQSSNNFDNHLEVSFVGRPFPLEEADSHLDRLRYWGFNCLRLLTTWEAIEHQGPKKYDFKYLDYITKIIEIAGDKGFYVFIDPHQDVWSRMTGGDGAPGWTFEKVGLDFTTFRDNGGAKVMEYHYPENYDAMEWFLNYLRFGTATMFTLFFGSEDFAPELTIDGISAQSYLQSHFTESMLQIATRVKDMEHVIGFDSMNEPNAGYLGVHHLDKFPEMTPPGLNFTPFDSIASGGGYPRMAKKIELKLLWLREIGQEYLNPERISSWIVEDVWMNHGIYEDVNGSPVLLQPEYFKYRPNGTPVNFFRDYLKPFVVEYTNKIREIIPESLIFIEGQPNEPKLCWEPSDPKGVVNASHWYDAFTLLMKKFNPWFTINTDTIRPVFLPYFVKRYHLRHLGRIQTESEKIHNGIPTLIGEFGIPYDMNNAEAFRTGDFSDQIRALDHYYNLMDELQLHSTQWNYTADNDNKWGDQWNLEDLSIYSSDQFHLHSGINSGGRALLGFCRPYPQTTSGLPLKWEYKKEKRKFTMNFRAKPGVTKIYLPELVFQSPKVTITPDAAYVIKAQYLEITTNDEREYNVVVT